MFIKVGYRPIHHSSYYTPIVAHGPIAVKEKHQTVIIETPEHFELHFRLAGIGSRFFAYLIDRLIQLGCILALVLTAVIVVMAFGMLAGLGAWLTSTAAFLGNWAFALAISIVDWARICNLLNFIVVIEPPLKVKPLSI